MEDLASPPSKKMKQAKHQFVSPKNSCSLEGSSTDVTTSSVSNNESLSCMSECCLGGLTPFQPTEPTVVVKLRKKQGDRYRNFSPSWFQTHPWLSVCITRGKAFCAYCRYCSDNQLLGMSKKGEAFTSNGFDNWKKACEKFNQHSQSDLHKEAMLKLEVINQESVSALLSKQQINDQKVHHQMLLKQISSLKFLLRQGLAIRGHNELEGNLLQLMKLRSEDCPELKVWLAERKYFSPSILNEPIALMGLSVLRMLLADIRKAYWFSLIVDEATDASNKEQLVVCIRWVDEDFNINEDAVELIQVPRTDASTLTSALKDCLIRFSLPISQCRGQAFDGASNMSGHLNGVAAQIQKDVPAALFVHCFAHCTNLCPQSIGRQCACIRDALDFVMEASQLIRYSPKRSSLFEALQSQLCTDSKSLKPLCPTRWTVRTAAFDAVLSNYGTLGVAFEQINIETHDDYGRKAGGLLALMDKFSTFFGLKLSHLIFSGIEQLSLTLQGKDTTIQEAIMAAEAAVQYLQRLRSNDKFTEFYSKVVHDSKDLTSPPVLPRYRQPPRKPGDSSAHGHMFSIPGDYFRKHYYEVLDLITGELERRFKQKRGLPVVEVIEKALLDAANGRLNASDFPDELQIYSSDVDLPRLKIQFQMLPDLIRTRNLKVANSVPINNVTNVRTLCDVMNEITMSKEMFSEVIKLLRIFFTLPVSTSTAERSFSALRRLKTFLRSTMTQPRLNHCMMIYVHKDRANEINRNSIAKSFVTQNERRRH